MNDANDSILRVFKTLSPQRQRIFLTALGEDEASNKKVWNKYRVWFADQKRAGNRDWIEMFARTPVEACELSNMVRRTSLQIVDVELVP